MKHDHFFIRIVRGHDDDALSVPMSLPKKGVIKELALKEIVFDTRLDTQYFSRFVVQYSNTARIQARVLSGMLDPKTDGRLPDVVRAFRRAMAEIGTDPSATALASLSSSSEDGVENGGTFVLELNDESIDDKGYMQMLYVDRRLALSVPRQAPMSTALNEPPRERQTLVLEGIRSSVDHPAVRVFEIELKIDVQYCQILSGQTEVNIRGDIAYATQAHVDKILAKCFQTRIRTRCGIALARGPLDVVFLAAVAACKYCSVFFVGDKVVVVDPADVVNAAAATAGRRLIRKKMNVRIAPAEFMTRDVSAALVMADIERVALEFRSTVVDVPPELHLVEEKAMYVDRYWIKWVMLVLADREDFDEMMAEAKRYALEGVKDASPERPFDVL